MVLPMFFSLRYDKSKYHMKDVIIGKVDPGLFRVGVWKLQTVGKHLNFKGMPQFSIPSLMMCLGIYPAGTLYLLF